MPQTKEDFKQNIWNLLSTDVNANLAFAQLVIAGEKHNTEYFFTQYSIPIIKWIVITVYSTADVNDVLYQFSGDYYDFVAGPGVESGTPQWYQLKRYEGRNGMKLKTWLEKHGVQYFTDKKKKTQLRSKNESNVFEYFDYEALLSIDRSVDDTVSEDLSDSDLLNRRILRKAWDALSEKDKLVLQLLIIDKTPSLEAFEILKSHIHPAGGAEVMLTWNNKRKQDAVLVMKGRSLNHLIAKFNKLKNN